MHRWCSRLKTFFKILDFYYNIWIQLEKCIHMSTNKPSICPCSVVLGIAPTDFETVLWNFFFFYTKALAGSCVVKEYIKIMGPSHRILSSNITITYLTSYPKAPVQYPPYYVVKCYKWRFHANINSPLNTLGHNVTHTYIEGSVNFTSGNENKNVLNVSQHWWTCNIDFVKLCIFVEGELKIRSSLVAASLFT